MNKFLEDGEGNKSSSRALMVFGVVVVMIVWGLVSVRTGSIQEIPWGVVGIIATLVTGKQANSYLTEQRTPVNP